MWVNVKCGVRTELELEAESSHENNRNLDKNLHSKRVNQEGAVSPAHHVVDQCNGTHKTRARSRFLTPACSTCQQGQLPNSLSYICRTLWVIICFYISARSPALIVPQRHPLGRPWHTASLYASIAQLCIGIWACTSPLLGAPIWIRIGLGCSYAKCS